MKSPYFTEDHEIFRNTVNQFIQKEVVPFSEEWENKEKIPRNIWEKMGENGFLGINFPSKYGGSEADFFYSVVFLEELSKCTMGGFSAAVSVHQYMSIAHIYKVGSEYIKEKYLIPSIAGKKIGALAISEPNTGSDVSSIETKATKEDNYYILNGSKIFITNGFYADFATVAVKTSNSGSNGISLLVVDTNSKGFTSKKLKKLGWKCSDTAEISFDNVKVPIENLIGQENKGFYYLMESFQLERLVAAITSIGASENCIDLTLKYISERKAFKKNLDKFQVIRHTISELSSELEAAKQLTYYCAWLYDNGEIPVKECSMAKLITSELLKKIADSCLQFFGGYGYMDEYQISRIYRDARVGTIVGGTSEIMKEVISKIIIDSNSYKSVY